MIKTMHDPLTVKRYCVSCMIRRNDQCIFSAWPTVRTETFGNGYHGILIVGHGLGCTYAINAIWAYDRSTVFLYKRPIFFWEGKPCECIYLSDIRCTGGARHKHGIARQIIF